MAEVYPNKPIHTMDNKYNADKIKDTDEGCNKDYNESPSITGGLTHITYMHSINKGFTKVQAGKYVFLILETLFVTKNLKVKGII